MQVVELTFEDNRLVIRKAHDFTLDELLDGITPENIHEEIDFGGPVGKENW